MSIDLERYRQLHSDEDAATETLSVDQPVPWWHLPLDIMAGAGCALILIYVAYHVAARWAS